MAAGENVNMIAFKEDGVNGAHCFVLFVNFVERFLFSLVKVATN